MTKTEAKQKAQDLLLNAMESAYYPTAEDIGVTERTREKIMEQVGEQTKRVRKLFGY